MFEGTRLYGSFRGGIEVCGIVACSNDDITSCGRVKEGSQTGVQFDSIVIERRNVSEEVNIFPTTLLFPSLSPMRQDEYSFIKNSLETVQMRLLTDKQTNLFSFAVYGRDESRDD